MTPEQLAAITARAEAATAGPWRVGRATFACYREHPSRLHHGEPGCAYTFDGWSDDWHSISRDLPYTPDSVEIENSTICGNYDYEEGGVATTPEDAAFIAAARTDLPTLVAEVERLREALAWYADPTHYQQPALEWIGDGDRFGSSEADLDEGERARDALREG